MAGSSRESSPLETLLRNVVHTPLTQAAALSPADLLYYASFGLPVSPISAEQPLPTMFDGVASPTTSMDDIDPPSRASSQVNDPTDEASTPAATPSADHRPDEQSATEVWRMFNRAKEQLSHSSRVENLAWRIMSLSLKRKQRSDHDDHATERAGVPQAKDMLDDRRPMLQPARRAAKPPMTRAQTSGDVGTGSSITIPADASDAATPAPFLSHPATSSGLDGNSALLSSMALPPSAATAATSALHYPFTFQLPFHTNNDGQHGHSLPTASTSKAAPVEPFNCTSIAATTTAAITVPDTARIVDGVGRGGGSGDGGGGDDVGGRLAALHDHPSAAAAMAYASSNDAATSPPASRDAASKAADDPPAIDKAGDSDTSSNVACKNCETTVTPLWRRDPEGKPLCNACGLFLKLHGVLRPKSLKTTVIKKRKRRPRPVAIAQPNYSRLVLPTHHHAHYYHHHAVAASSSMAPPNKRARIPTPTAPSTACHVTAQPLDNSGGSSQPQQTVAMAIAERLHQQRVLAAARLAAERMARAEERSGNYYVGHALAPTDEAMEADVITGFWFHPMPQYEDTHPHQGIDD